MNPTFWKDKRVFVTGHTGFKGSWLSLWLQQMGATVKGYSLEPPTIPNLFQIGGVATHMDSEIGDIRNYGQLAASLAQFKPEVVFHLAAQPLVRLAYSDPVDTYSTNVMGTVNLLDACRKVEGIKAILNITSDKCYENREWVWGYREDDALGGYDPYSNSKGCSELVTAAFRNSYFNNAAYGEHGCAVASVRAGNVIGGGDWAADRLIPDILKAFDRGESVEIRNPHATRPWQHVLEPLSGYLMLAERLFIDGPEFAEGWNFGPYEQDARPVSWIVEAIARHWGESAQWHISDGDHPHEAHYLKLDCSKAKARLNWLPAWDLETTLKSIVEWHRAWKSNHDMHAYTINELNQYTRDRSGI